MDPVSQAFLGAAAGQSLSKKNQETSLLPALIIGGLGGLSPDLDVLISSSTDSLLHIEYHRHFTHSIFFAPIAGLFVSAVLYPFFRARLNFKRIYVLATVGAMTHGFLDACTSYGTHLFWPLVSTRESWNIISIIDPLFTLPLLAACLWSLKKSSVLVARCGLLWVLLYLCFGLFQYQRASEFYKTELELIQGAAQPQEVLVKPTIANLWVWRGVAVYDENYRVDGLRLGVFKNNELYQGRFVDKFKALDPWSSYMNDGQVSYDLKRFEFFSEGLIYQVPGQDELVGDLRYSLLPHSVEPLWVVELTPGQPDQEGLEFYHTRNVTKQKRELFKQMLLGKEIKQEELDKY